MKNCINSRWWRIVVALGYSISRCTPSPPVIYLNIILNTTSLLSMNRWHWLFIASYRRQWRCTPRQRTDSYRRWSCPRCTWHHQTWRSSDNRTWCSKPNRCLDTSTTPATRCRTCRTTCRPTINSLRSSPPITRRPLTRRPSVTSFELRHPTVVVTKSSPSSVIMLY